MANSGLSRTAVDGNRQTFTHSFWVKRSKVGAESCLFYSRINSNNHFLIRFTGSDQLELVNRVSGSNNYFVTTNRKFRDTSAWYNILVQVDTTQGTSGDRIKFYVNGVQETSFATQTIGSQSANMSTNYNTATLYFGQEYTSGSNFFEGYMSHVALVDGAVSAPTVFGETDSTSGIWKFKSPTGVTWGNNGVHLKFENSANLGLDSSGETHNYTVNGNGRQALDTPSNVYATGNPLSSNVTMSNGNLTFSGAYNLKSTLAFSKGKYYAECKVTNSNTYNPILGIGQVGSVNIDNPAGTGYHGNTPNSYGYQRDGKVVINGSTPQTGLTTVAQNDIVGIAVDLDSATKTIKWYINGTLSATQNITETASEPYVFWTYASGSQAGEGSWNFGNGYFGTTAISSAGSNGNGSLFEYDVPSGYYALNTKNINTYG